MCRRRCRRRRHRRPRRPRRRRPSVPIEFPCKFIFTLQHFNLYCTSVFY